MSITSKDIISLSQARAKLTELCDEVRTKGTEKLITKNGGPRLTRHPVAERRQPVLQILQPGQIDIEGGLAADAFSRLVGVDGAGVAAMGQVVEAQAVGAPLLGQTLAVRAGQVAHRAIAGLLQGRDHGGADAGQDPHRLARQKRFRLGADHRKAARLVQFGGDLGQELVGRQADGDREAGFRLDPRL